MSSDSIVWLDLYEGNTVSDALQQLGFADSDISNVFRNGRLAVGEQTLLPGDRLGVFPLNMCLLYC